MAGKLVIFSAPSGTGKTTIVHEILQRNLNLEFSISACTRPPRKGEIHGEDYYFLSVEEFKNTIEEKGFVEWEEVYHNQYYGTLFSEIDRIWKKNNHVIFDIDVKGGLNLKEQFKDSALSVFIMPPSVAELERRLRKRGTDDEVSIKKRMDKAEYEMSFASRFDTVIINKELEKAVEETYGKLKTFLLNV